MSDTYGGEPSLDDARARVARASEHLASLENEILSGRRQPNLNLAAALSDGAYRETINLPARVSVLIGEIVYNLRAALDYLVYELVYLDFGKPKGGTKFLIEETEQGWLDHLSTQGLTNRQIKKLWLPCLTADHQAALKRLQPFDGCQWTLELRSLSNPDKHRRLTRAISTFEGTVMDGPPTAAAIPPEFPAEMFVHIHLSETISLGEGAHEVETLHLMQQQVADVIEAFDPDFR